MTEFVATASSCRSEKKADEGAENGSVAIGGTKKEEEVTENTDGMGGSGEVDDA